MCVKGYSLVDEIYICDVCTGKQERDLEPQRGDGKMDWEIKHAEKYMIWINIDRIGTRQKHM